MFRLVSLCAAASLLLPAAPAAAQAGDRPNLSGRWLLSVERSTFGGQQVPVAETDDIVHAGSSLRIHRARDFGQGPTGIDLIFGTDGKEYRNQTPSGTTVTVGRWVGDTLELVATLPMEGGVVVEVTDRYTLSPDGLALTMQRQIVVPVQGAVTQTYVFRKAQ